STVATRVTRSPRLSRRLWGCRRPSRPPPPQLDPTFERSRVPLRCTTLAEWREWFETLHLKKIHMSHVRSTVIPDAVHHVPSRFMVITVGGRNGKGSCVAILESIYRAAGYRVGAFTSPHLVRFNERIRFEGRDATDAELVEVFESVEESLGPVTLSYFEA